MRPREYVCVDEYRADMRLPPGFDTVPYGELWSRLSTVAADWYHHAEHPAQEGDFVAPLGFAGTDCSTVDLTCGQVGAVAVPLQTNASVDHIRHPHTGSHFCWARFARDPGRQFTQLAHGLLAY